ncbi:Crp/Fnr family transcriptional regulator [Reichenbachiella versicolor]|uniref:Crp/Fnr family transcriptional regulator n=1 Tax=Reichenbachiella versicolor TaxID=1821036 RepID=UPI000D6E1251|nr:Crp/Fnr family transcriptional regulator [Reichenbachiella versicolor]
MKNTLSTDLNLLKSNFSKYVELTDAAWETISSAFLSRDIARREFVLKKGEICRMEGFVIEGCFKVSTTDQEGKESILYFAAEDWWLMEIDSFLNATPSELYIQALEDSRVLFISKSDKEELYTKAPEIERLFRIMAQTAVAAWQRRVVRNLNWSAEKRYSHFLDTYPNIAKRVTNKDIASYLGITQEFVSKLRKKRMKEGK